MSFDQYHEPASEMKDETRDFARIITSLTEEAEAISWYEQRIAASKDPEVKAIMRHSMEEEFEHFAIALEWLTRRLPKWRAVLKEILFKDGDIIENAEAAEEKLE